MSLLGQSEFAAMLYEEQNSWEDLMPILELNIASATYTRKLDENNWKYTYLAMKIDGSDGGLQAVSYWSIFFKIQYKTSFQ